MEKHYTFIEFNENTLLDFRKTLLSDAFRKILALIAAAAVIMYISIRKKSILLTSPTAFPLICLIMAVLCLFAAVQLSTMLKIMNLTLADILKTTKSDDFYTEEVKGGIIMQRKEICQSDVNASARALLDFAKEDPEDKRHMELVAQITGYLKDPDPMLQSKGVIYTELILDQLKKGNASILDSIYNYMP